MKQLVPQLRLVNCLAPLVAGRDGAVRCLRARELHVEDRFAIVPGCLLDADVSDAAVRLYAVLRLIAASADDVENDDEPRRCRDGRNPAWYSVGPPRGDSAFT